MPYSRTMLATIHLLLVFVLVSGFSASMQRAAGAQQTTTPALHNGKIAFAGIRSEDTDTNNWEIYTVNADGSGLVKNTNNPAIDVDPAWSPDGAKIAFMRNDANVSASGFNNEDIYVMNADGSGQKKLTDESGDDSHPTWSPDGSKIAFTSNREQSLDIFIMDADDGNVRRLTDNGRANVNPSWSPDGTKVAYQSQASSESYEGWEIHTINVDGTGEKALTNNDTADILPDWSPDGRRIVFQGSTGAEVMNADGTAQSQVFPGATDPAWSPDGKKILFVGVDGITTINPDGSSQTTITSPPNLTLLGPDWQPLAGAGTGDANNNGADQGTGDATGNAGNGTAADGANEPNVVRDAGGVINGTASTRQLPGTGGSAILAPAMGLLLISGAVARLLMRPR